MVILDWLRRLVGSLRPDAGFQPTAIRGPHFAVEPKPGAVRLFHLRGNQAGLSQVMFEVIRQLPDPVGIILVEYRERTREWVREEASRSRLLEALLGVRDLVGAGLLDVAVFSPERGLELILGRSGDLEIRTGNWNEPLLRSLFDAAGFVEAPLDQLTPVLPLPEAMWDEAIGDRVEAARLALELHPPVADQQR